MPTTSGSPTQLATTVETPVELAGVPDDAFKSGDRAFVAALQPSGRFYLDRSSVTAPDNIGVIDTFTGNGRWLVEGDGEGGGANWVASEAYVQPAVGDTVQLTLSTGTLEADQVLYVYGGGYYAIESNDGAGAYTARNLGGTETAAPAVAVPASHARVIEATVGATVGVVGLDFVQPPVGQTVVATISGATALSVEQIIYISRAGIPETGGFYRVTQVAGAQVTLLNTGSVGNAAPATTISTGSMVNVHGAALNTILGFGINVMAFGAVGDGTTDDTLAIQAALDAAEAPLGGATVWFPPGRYLITASLTIGGPANHVSGVVLRGMARGLATGARSSLVWGGAAGGTLMVIRNAHSGSIADINFDAGNIADYCIQARHVAGDVSTTEVWHILECRFEGAAVSNVLLGDTVPSPDDCSAWLFTNCFFGRSWVNALTDSHVTQNGWNSFGTTFVGCQFYGTNEGGTYYPLHGIRAVGGTIVVIGGSMNALGQSDIYLVGDPGSDPCGVTTDGVESQSYCFLETDIAGSGIPQRSVVINGGYHTDSSAAGSTESIIWDVPTGFMALVLNGFRPQLDVQIGAGSKVFASGVVFTGAANFSGAGASEVSGNWYVNNGYITSYSGAHRRNLGAYDQTYGLGAFQTYGSLCPQAFGLANAGTYSFAGPPSIGMVLVTWDGNPLFYGAAALFILHAPAVPGTGVSAEVSDPSGQFSAVAGNPGTVNVYWDAGTSRWVLQNNLGGGGRFTIAYLGVGPT